MNDNSDDQGRLLELEREQWFRECRREFTRFCFEALSPRGESPALHHRLICQELEAVARGQIKRLMLLAPPGSAKTTYVSRLFPAWYFAFRPRSSIIAVSHTQELAETNSGFVQRIVRDNSEVLAYRLANDAKGRWYTDSHCGYLAAGVGAAILGFRANTLRRHSRRTSAPAKPLTHLGPVSAADFLRDANRRQRQQGATGNGLLCSASAN